MNPTRILASLSLLVSGFSLAAAAADPLATLPRSTPEEQGVSSAAILNFIQTAEKKVDAFHSFVLIRHGKVVAEGWWSPYSAEEPHVLFSLSKSFTSTAVGLAIAEGKLSLTDPVLKFFPEEAPASPSKNLQAMRVKDLLRMQTGQVAEDVDKFPFQSSEDLVKLFLALPVTYKPGTHFVYNTEATYMLSAIVQKVTGQTVLDYLGPRLFEPLGIAHPTWEKSAQGISFGGFGLSIRTEDIARFGQLYLQKGQWKGKQLVPSEWVEAATSLQTSNGSSPDSDWDQGYGYQFWRCRHGFFRGDGAFGLLCIVMPEFDAVFAATAGTGDMQGEMNAIWDTIVPGFSPKPLPADPESDRKLAEKLAGLTLPAVSGSADTPIAAKIAGKRYGFPENPMGLESLSYEPVAAGAPAQFKVRIRGKDEVVSCGNGSWIRQELSSNPEPTAVSGAWTSPDTFTLSLCNYRTPFIWTDRIKFTDDGVEFETQPNVGFGGSTPKTMTGKVQP